MGRSTSADLARERLQMLMGHEHVSFDRSNAISSLRNDIAALLRKHASSESTNLPQAPMQSERARSKVEYESSARQEAHGRNRTIYFVALIRREDGVYRASFPDLTGCTVTSNDPDALVAEAEEALAIHIQSMIKNGSELPVPRSLAQVAADSNFVVNADNLIIALVPYIPESRAARLHVTLDSILLARIDQAAKNAGERRSEYLAEAARQRLARETGSGRRDTSGAAPSERSMPDLPTIEADDTVVLQTDTVKTLESIREMLRHLDRPMLNEAFARHTDL